MWELLKGLNLMETTIYYHGLNKLLNEVESNNLWTGVNRVFFDNLFKTTYLIL